MSEYEVMLQLNRYARIMQQELDKQPVGSHGEKRFAEWRRAFVYAAGALTCGDVKRLIQGAHDE